MRTHDCVEVHSLPEELTEKYKKVTEKYKNTLGVGVGVIQGMVTPDQDPRDPRTKWIVSFDGTKKQQFLFKGSNLKKVTDMRGQFWRRCYAASESTLHDGIVSEHQEINTMPKLPQTKEEVRHVTQLKLFFHQNRTQDISMFHYSEILLQREAPLLFCL